MNILENVYIKDKDKLNNKIKQIKEDGKDKLHIISDFDKTLTKVFLQDIKYRSAIAQIRDGGYLENNYPRRSEALYEKYYPIEINPNIPFEEKKEKMLEWWSTHIKMQVECGLNISVVNEINNKRNIKLREGVIETFNLLNENNIPILILSSAVGDFIEFVIKDNNIFYPNIHIITNFYNYDDAGKVIGYKDKVIHNFNKNEAAIKETPHFDKTKDRPNVLLFGDSLNDIKMIEGVDHKTVIFVGFLNNKIEERLELFKDKYDIVITNDGSFEQILELLKEIL